MVIPVFKSTYSHGKSILTFETDCEEDGPDSIIEICLDRGIKDLVLVEDNLTSFMKAFKACDSNGINLIYGVSLIFCSDMQENDTNSFHKGVIFAKDDKGCEIMNKIYSCANTESGFLSKKQQDPNSEMDVVSPRIDYKNFYKYWDEKHLSFVVPFYDSFIHKNNFYHREANPDFSKIKNPIFWVENNNLPFDHLISKKVLEYTEKNGYKTCDVKSILYKNKEDIEAFQTYRVLCNRANSKRGDLQNPELDHFGSDEFCIEAIK
jgi:DNA polymerase III alpha subunit